MADVSQRIQRAAAQRLESLASAGVRQLGRQTVAIAPAAASSAGTDESLPGPGAERHAAQKSTPQGDIDVASALAVLQQEVAACQRCELLAETRTQTVFGVGNPQARLCFLGEAPGADEDRQGEPFVGRAGQLLTKIIEACTLKREDVYILNVLKCRPPKNRNPLPDEVHNCRGYLNRQLELIQPEYICCLGSVAAQTLLETDTTIGKLRGEFHDYRGIPVMCTYHPAYLLRNPSAKREVWSDMKRLLHELGIELS